MHGQAIRRDMASNSIAPSVKALDIYLDGTDWKVDLYAENGTTQIASTTIGSVEVDADSIVAVPLDIQAMLGAAAHEIRVHGAGVLKVRHVEAAKSSFPVAALTVVEGEVLGQQIASIVAIGSGITRLRIAVG